MAFVSPHELRDAEAAQRARGRQIGVQGVRVDGDVLHVVRPGRGKAGLLRHARPDVGVRAAVPPHLALARDEAAGTVDAALDAKSACMLGDGEELLLHAERDLHRPLHEQREHRDQRFQLDVELRAESAAQERHAHAHAVLGPAQEPRDLDPHERRALRRGVDGERVLGALGHRHQRLERRMHHLLRAEAMLEYALGALHGARRIAAPQPEVERDVGILHALQVLEIGKGAGGLQRLVHDRLRAHRLHLVVDGRQLVVFGGDEVHRFFRHVRVGREHHCHRLANVAHLVQRKHGLIVERRSVVRIRHHGLYFRRGDNAVHAGHGPRGSRVDAPDAPVRNARAEDLGVEHAGQAQVVHVLRAAGNLEPRLEPRHRAADLRGLSALRCALHGSPGVDKRR